MSILIVDDSPDQQALLHSILTTAGYHEIVTAGSAQDAFACLNVDDPNLSTGVDLILMDIVMPELDGVAACRQIKNHERLRDIPIIMVTAQSDLAILKEAFAAGAMDYISKPVNRTELLARVSSALTLKKEMDCRKTRELDLQRSNEELQQALREVKVLRGLIPICASCKKIRNDQGFWQQLEEYLEKHSEAEFTHCLCAPCKKKLYPDLYKA